MARRASTARASTRAKSSRMTAEKNRHAVREIFLTRASTARIYRQSAAHSATRRNKVTNMTNEQTTALEQLADAMVEADRNSGECTADVLDDADAGSSDHWDASGVYDVAEEMGLSAATVDAIGWNNIRDAYAAAWRAAVELELSSRDEVAS